MSRNTYALDAHDGTGDSLAGDEVTEDEFGLELDTSEWLDESTDGDPKPAPTTTAKAAKSTPAKRTTARKSTSKGKRK